jgi:hypothetical protein
MDQVDTLAVISMPSMTAWQAGFGTPDKGYVIRWLHSEESRQALGYPETIRQLELKLGRCHRASREFVRLELETATRGQGSTAFDWLVGDHA